MQLMNLSMYYQKPDLCIHFKPLSTHHHTTNKSTAVKWYAITAETVEGKMLGSKGGVWRGGQKLCYAKGDM